MFRAWHKVRDGTMGRPQGDRIKMFTITSG
jgi:hypothetical protein